MNKYKYVLFDLDGTILNTFEGVTRSFAYALEHYGIYVKDLKELTPVLGPPLYDAFVSMYGFSHDSAIEAVAKYRERYSVKFVEESKLYPGIKDTIRKLSEDGFNLVIATSKPEHFARNLLDHYALTQYFSFFACASLDKSRDSKEKVLKYLIDELNLNPKEAVMVGDRKFDLTGAAHFGIDAIGVLYGFAPDGELEKSPNVYLAKDADELYNYIKNA